MNEHDGKVYQALSGQWSWVIYQGDEEYCRGAGYDSEVEAESDLLEQLELLGSTSPQARLEAAEVLLEDARASLFDARKALESAMQDEQAAQGSYDRALRAFEASRGGAVTP
jgi:hypothetical protein